MSHSPSNFNISNFVKLYESLFQAFNTYMKQKNCRKNFKFDNVLLQHILIVGSGKKRDQKASRLATTCSTLTIEALEQGVKYVQS